MLKRYSSDMEEAVGTGSRVLTEGLLMPPWAGPVRLVLMVLARESLAISAGGVGAGLGCTRPAN